MNVLVLGGTGTVGRPLVSSLRARGASARVGTRAPAHHEGGVAFAFERPETWPAALSDVRRVFLLMPAGLTRPDEVAAALVPELVKAGVERVVNLSGFGVERTESPMRRAELALDRSGLSVTHLRPNYFMQNFCAGPLQDGVRTRGDIAVAAAEARISFIDARDIAAVAAEALFTDVGPALSLTGPAAVTHAEIAAAIASATGRPIAYRPLDDADARRELASAGLTPDRIEARLGFLALARTGALSPVTGDVERVLGRPAVSWERFAREHAAHWSTP